jgi:hypothetical protein
MSAGSWPIFARFPSHTLSVSDKLITESLMSHCPETGFGEIDG